MIRTGLHFRFATHGRTNGPIWYGSIRLSDSRAFSDLHAADARYHYDFRLKFMGGKNVVVAANQHDNEITKVDSGYEKVRTILCGQREKMWTSVEVHQLYKDCDGYSMSRPEVVGKLSRDFGDELVIVFSWNSKYPFISETRRKYFETR